MSAVAILGWFVQPITPWWSIAILAVLAAAIFGNRYWSAIGAAFLGGFILWYFVASQFDAANESILSGRIGTMLGGLSASMVLVATGVIGGITAALGGWLGYALKSLVMGDK
ncbi:MAG: hypothetical protein AAFO07_04950 [Bacteroidota bacterium]